MERFLPQRCPRCVVAALAWMNRSRRRHVLDGEKKGVHQRVDKSE